MFDISILEVAIGLVFAYAIITAICTGIYELIAKLFSLRAKYLREGIQMMLADPKNTKIVQLLYSHHLIGSKLEAKAGKIENIPAANFAIALLETILAESPGAADTPLYTKVYAALTTGDFKSIPQPVKDEILKLVQNGGATIEQARGKIETWFDHNMEAVSRWYKTNARIWVSLIAVAVVGFFNVDSIKISKSLWTDDELRAASMAAIENYAEEHSETQTTSGVANGETHSSPQTTREYFDGLNMFISNVVQSIEEANTLPLLWESEKIPAENAGVWWVEKIAGLLLTILAVILGGPYWFDLLKYLLNLRKQLKGGGNADSANPPPPGPPAGLNAPPPPPGN